MRGCLQGSAGLLGGLERALEVVNQVVRVLQADRQADRPLRDAALGHGLVGHAEVRGAGRVDHQRAAVAHVGQVAEYLERLDELLALLAMPLDVEAEDRPRAARQQLLRQRMAGMRRQHRMPDP